MVMRSIDTHLHEMMEGLPVRMDTHRHHILKDTTRLCIQTLLGARLQQAVVCRPIRPDALRLHALHDRQHCAGLSAVKLRGDHHVEAGERGVCGAAEAGVGPSSKSSMRALVR